MKGTNIKRALLISTSVILVCMSVVVGVTWALFTDTKKVTHHLQAGDLSITLKRTELVKTTLDDSGYLVTLEPNKTVENFTGSKDENVFGIESDEKLVPGSKFVAKMQIENHSDVAFGYWLEIVCTDKASGENLAKQLKVSVNTGSEKSGFVGNGLVVRGANDDCIDELEIGEVKTFTVTVEFVDSFISSNGLDYYDNDLAQNENLDFDLIVHAVQSTTAPTS